MCFLQLHVGIWVLWSNIYTFEDTKWEMRWQNQETVKLFKQVWENMVSMFPVYNVAAQIGG